MGPFGDCDQKDRGKRRHQFPRAVRLTCCIAGGGGYRQRQAGEFYFKVGFADGEDWTDLREFDSENRAAAWVSYLNGGLPPPATS